MRKQFLVKSLVVLSLTAGLGCGTGRQLVEKDAAPAGTSLHHESLLSVLWTQTAVEYAGLTRGVYTLAALQLDRALEDSSWTASLEQLGTGGYEALPPAVVLDLDETVLDNSAFQARLIRDGNVFDRSIWNAWVSEEKSLPIPGALEFTRYAATKGVQVIYLTNREPGVEEATRNNLEALGFPVSGDGFDVVLTKGERPDWASSNKTPRREFVAENYRVLLLIGDNYGDFSEASRGSLTERMRSSEGFASYWGKKWIVLPNAMYGSWEGALYEFDYGRSGERKLEAKRSLLYLNR